MNLKVSQIVLMASGAVTFLFSFFAFYSFSGMDWDGNKKTLSYNAWSGDADTLFIASWVAIFGLIIGGLAAAKAFADFELPEILTFRQEQIYVALAIPGLLIMFGYLINDGDKGFGFFLMLLGALGLVAGSIMEVLGVGGAVGGSGGQAGFGGYGGPQQGGYPPQGPPQGPPPGGGYPPQGPPQGGSF